MSQITLLTGERRRTWTDEQKLAILDEAFGGSAVVADVARRHEISTGLLYTWRRNALAARDESGFVPAVVVE
ncbi:MAG: transposase, partial [bacterium]|nr:transposase [bacterium]